MSVEQSLIADTPRLSPDEQSLFRELFDRVLQTGRSRYPAWVETNDTRHLPRERDEEIFDAVIYAAMLVVRRKRERAERLKCFIADESFRKVNAGLTELVAAAEDSACPDCLAPQGLSHRDGCAWTVLPGKEAV